MVECVFDPALWKLGIRSPEFNAKNPHQFLDKIREMDEELIPGCSVMRGKKQAESMGNDYLRTRGKL